MQFDEQRVLKTRDELAQFLASDAGQTERTSDEFRTATEAHLHLCDYLKSLHERYGGTR